ncbi:bifunctional DNA-formamidopyrimidine glycosylase/DNA-(apurinic or apyrimidinic site) lyase [Patescibacteria group bacterium]|nr:bifunctional DNA-formamidopyrimidine glycosylase/DNA-(apurinic or apyrimidinic site) lyase [Patescibacteria group bacterium]
MPELPEVETIRRGLEDVLVGREFLGAEVLWGKSLVCEGVDVDDLRGCEVLAVERRGKFLVMRFSSGFVVTVHLRMSGRLIAEEDGGELPFERVRMRFSGGLNLKFCDMRKFGRVWVSSAEEYEKLTGIWKLGPEPLLGDVGAEVFEGKRGAVKKVLLDQTVLAGVGNIYADEACFYAGVRPDARMEKLSRGQLEKLFEGVVVALKQGIRNRGTSISDFEDAFGGKGKNQELLYVYGRGGKECLKCGGVLERGKVAGRTTVWCEVCQGEVQGKLEF